ncbi:DUF1249 domain-containing protein [Aliidiomarina soli]|uniref:DUF1249 domain-containing protein n=2 Tax=Idiomarinaceae TaxID=267893 RepID=A0A432WD93_9GAMM|nr:DUF1249 domain-containing protein [Aliidiomarina soli]
MQRRSLRYNGWPCIKKRCATSGHRSRPGYQPRSSMNKKRYVPDLRELQSLAERNYAAACGLLADEYQQGDVRQLTLGEGLNFSVTILTAAPYTTDIKVEQQSAAADYLKSSFVVRLYHDMQLAEMISSQGLERFAATYEQPNPQMHQRDEKRQINHFLADWLRLCFHRGHWHDVAISTSGTTFEFQVKR